MNDTPRYPRPTREEADAFQKQWVEATPRYPHVIVDLTTGGDHEVFNRVVLALRDADVPPHLRDTFIVEATVPDELRNVCRRWVGEQVNP